MLLIDQQIESEGLLDAARLICLAARTAPKGKGKDLLVTAVLAGEEKAAICQRMREIGETKNSRIFSRDAANVEASPLLIMLGTRTEPLGVANCGFCGYENCAGMLAAQSICSFNTGDLGIAIGSAVSRAADLRIDNRIMFTAGRAALDLQLLGKEIKVAYGIPLSATSKSPFFDRS